MVAADRVSRPQKVCAPCRASSIWSVISLKVVSTRLRHSAMIFCRMAGMSARWCLLGGMSTAVPWLAWAAAKAVPRKPEAAGPFGVRGVAAEPGGQVVARAGPAVRAADPGGVLDRDGAGAGLLAVIDRPGGRQRLAELLEGAPQPADPPVGLGLVRQPREQVRPVPGHLGQEPGLAAPAQQMPDYRDGQQLGVTAGRFRSRPGRDGDGPGRDQVVDQHVDVGLCVPRISSVAVSSRVAVSATQP